jgi:pyruvate,water dikinase
MTKDKQYILWFKDISKEDVGIVGGKGANLGEMYNNKFPIPPGFCVSADVYFDFIKERKIDKEIEWVLEGLDVDDIDQLRQKSEKIQKIIVGKAMPLKIQNAIKEAHKGMQIMGDDITKVTPTAIQLIKSGREPIFLAVRSSATAEDLPEASFAGQQATFLNVKGEEELLRAVQLCWASLFTARAIFYREKNNFPHMKVGISVIIQKMVNSDKAGVAFSVNPTTNNKEQILIEGSFGLGEAVVAGHVTPDNYIVDKKSFEILEKNVKSKKMMIIRDPGTGKNKHVILEPKKADSSALSDEEIVNLAKIVAKIEKHYNFPQDIEWAIEGNKIEIVQSRPVTTLKRAEEDDVIKEGIRQTTELLQGLGASPGLASGPVKIVHGLEELNKIEQGDILVTKMTNPDMVPAMKKAAAIVTDEGGTTSHAAIVSREMGIPAIVGTGAATSVLKEGEIITVNADDGLVVAGDILEKRPVKKEVKEIVEYIPTKTKILMNLGIPDMIDEYLNLNFDGIGLMRIEFIIASKIKKHPLALIESGEQQTYVDELADGIAKVAGTINPKPLIVRFSDFKSNEYRELEGGEKYEPIEANPMLGWRGASRYISENFEPVFRLECQAIRKLRESYKNIHVMLPFVRTVDETKKCLDIMREEGLVQSNDLQIWLMAEVPSVVFLADKFAKLGIAGFSIGSNDLTQMILGVDRDSQLLGKMGYFDERNPAILRALRYLINEGHKYNVKVSICGQGPSKFPEFAQFLVHSGIDSISVNPDVVNKTRKIVSDAEAELT